jgi:hypothetical protein
MARSGRRSGRQSSGGGFRWGGFSGGTCGIVAMVLLVGWQRPALEDWLVPVPTPAPEIARLAIATGMTPTAQRLFYRQSPTIAPQASFASRCKVPEQGIMLGCYSSGRDGQGKIVIQAVADPRLRGVMETTAAHEMLHAAYQRLSPARQHWLAPRLQRAAQRVTDQRLQKILRQYEKGDNEALYWNELHSHLGTELEDLGDPELEAHYQQYFHDRAQVVAFAQRSGSNFKHLDIQAADLKPRIDAQEAHLKQLKQQLDEAETNLKQSAGTLDRLGADLDRTKAQAEQVDGRNLQRLGLIDQFEQQKSVFNAEVDRHNEQVHQQKDRVAIFNEKVDAYKQDVKAYNQIAKEERSLMDGLRGEINPTQPKKPTGL